MLDYKIKELKKQIEPREVEIMDMKEQIKDMDLELERYHKNSASLDLTISDLRLKQSGLQREVLSQRRLNADSEAVIKRFHHDLHETVQHVQEPKALKESVKQLYQKYVTEQVEPLELEQDIQTEYNRQREYLEKIVETAADESTPEPIVLVLGTADNIAHALDADEDAFRGVKIISMGGTLAWDEVRRLCGNQNFTARARWRSPRRARPPSSSTSSRTRPSRTASSRTPERRRAVHASRCTYPHGLFCV